jgi:P2-related tail formation protein
MKILTLILIVASIVFVPILADAHQSGCHRWHSCPSDSGSYTCGDTGYCSGCPDNQYCKSGQYSPSTKSGYTSQSSSSYTKSDLSVSLSIKENPITRGSLQTIFVTVTSDGSKISGASVHGDIIYTAGYTKSLDSTTDSNGKASLSWTIGGTSNPGKFSVKVTASKSGYNSDYVQNTFLVIAENEPVKQTPEIETKQKTTPQISNPLTPETRMSKTPEWIKNNARWWADGQIGNSDFLKGVEYLVKQNIIHVKSTSSEKKTSEVPSWLKNTAKWWAEGMISEDEFLRGIKYLAENGIIQTGPNSVCKGNAQCIEGVVTSITDGDTIRVNGQAIRFALSAAPEMSQPGGREAKSFITQMCPVDSKVIVDEDDGQTDGSFGRIIAQVFCNGQSLNAALLENEFGIIDSRFCSVSEFASEDWALKFGC